MVVQLMQYYIKKLVRELKLEDNVLFFKNISQNLKNAFISTSNVFVMPSIGGKDGGAADAILHKKTGLICDGNNLDEIYSSIQEILSENKFKEYGKAAKDFSESFTWDKIVKQYNSIITN